jgi:hypothetical protein
MSQEQTGAPTDLVGGMPATEGSAPLAGADAATGTDPVAAIGADARRVIAAVADHLIPSAHGMPSAAAVVDEARLRFVLTARPDLLEPLVAALRPELGDEPGARLDALGRDEPESLAALQLTIVAAYYSDRTVRELIGYPGQLAIEVRSWELPPFIEEGLIDEVLARGPVWRDPATGTRARVEGAPRSYAERYATAEGRSEGGSDGGHSS